MNAPGKRPSLVDAVRAAVLEVGLFDRTTQRHTGPADVDAEAFVIVSVLFGDVQPGALKLKPEAFCSLWNQRIWSAMLSVADPTDMEALQNAAFAQGKLLGPIADELERMKLLDVGQDWVRSMRDVEGAAATVRALARDRRLAERLVRLHADLVGKRLDADGAKVVLRDYFKSEAAADRASGVSHPRPT